MKNNNRHLSALALALLAAIPLAAQAQSIDELRREQRALKEKVDALEKKLKDAGVKFEFHRYQAKHAFANEIADTKNLPPLKYNPNAAQTAWERTLDFLGKTLK